MRTLIGCLVLLTVSSCYAEEQDELTLAGMLKTLEFVQYRVDMNGAILTKITEAEWRERTAQWKKLLQLEERRAKLNESVRKARDMDNEEGAELIVEELKDVSNERALIIRRRLANAAQVLSVSRDLVLLKTTSGSVYGIPLHSIIYVDIPSEAKPQRQEERP